MLLLFLTGRSCSNDGYRYPPENLHPMDKYYETNCVLQWIVIYPVNSAIQLLNNWGQVDKSYYNNNYNIVTIYTFNNSVVISKPTP